MGTLFRYMYDGRVDIPPDDSVAELVVVADMYDFSGLKDALSFIIKRDKCHFFHKVHVYL